MIPVLRTRFGSREKASLENSLRVAGALIKNFSSKQNKEYMTEEELEEVAVVLADSLDEAKAELKRQGIALARQKAELADLTRDMKFALDEIAFLKSARVPLGASARLPIVNSARRPDTGVVGHSDTGADEWWDGEGDR